MICLFAFRRAGTHDPARFTFGSLAPFFRRPCGRSGGHDRVEDQAPSFIAPRESEDLLSRAASRLLQQHQSTHGHVLERVTLTLDRGSLDRGLFAESSRSTVKRTEPRVADGFEDPTHLVVARASARAAGASKVTSTHPKLRARRILRRWRRVWLGSNERRAVIPSSWPCEHLLSSLRSPIRVKCLNGEHASTEAHDA